MDSSKKVLENRCRRMAARQGLRFMKVRRIDPLAIDYNTYKLLDEDGRRVAGGSLEAVEKALTRGRVR